jgi:hypothetical protein
MTSFTPLLIVTSLYEVIIERMECDDTFTPFLIVTSLCNVLVEGMEHDDIFHSSTHCDLTV